MSSLRETFDSAAALYHRARPSYPDQLFEDLAELAELGPESRILEIGPGTGIATLAMASRGFAVHGVEMGPALADEARRNLAGFPGVTIETGAFETHPLPRRAFDLIYAATAFHWIEQPTGYRRIAELLRPGGYFAEFRHYHVWSPESDRFFKETQEIYLRYKRDTQPDFRLPLPNDVETLESELLEAGLFERPAIRRYMQDVKHTPESYRDLLMTFSDHIAQPEPNRSSLINGIAEVIRNLPGSRATKTHLVLLHVAQLNSP